MGEEVRAAEPAHRQGDLVKADTRPATVRASKTSSHLAANSCGARIIRGWQEDVTHRATLRDDMQHRLQARWRTIENDRSK